MKPLRVVFDTNVYLAALFAPQGYASMYLREAGLRRRYVLCVSLEIFAETKQKFVSKLPSQATLVNELLDYISKVADVVHTTTVITDLSDDPDNRILECAVDGQADLIVSFDKDLLNLKTYKGIAIIHPSLLQDYFPR